MKQSILKFIDNFFHLKLEDSENQVAGLKQETVDKVKATNKTLKTAGKLQKKIMEKTTTYYLGKAVGAIKE